MEFVTLNSAKDAMAASPELFGENVKVKIGKDTYTVQAMSMPGKQEELSLVYEEQPAKKNGKGMDWHGFKMRGQRAAARYNN